MTPAHPVPRGVACALATAILAFAQASAGASLPPHPPMRILVVSDEVNPHALSDAELTQPGDIAAALLDPAAGFNLDPAPDGVVEIATDDLADATALLAVPITHASAYDVVVYFAHRIPAAGAPVQEAFVAALDAFLVAGGGLVSFHHGSYETAGKASVQQLIGATAVGSVPWNTLDGQNVINVAPGHFVTTNEVEYASSVSYSDPARSVPLGTYGLFNNTPDERYIEFEVNGTAGSFTVLFGSDYVENGSAHLLGFEHRRPTWAGVVIGYQPGEYQPSALDDLEGNNFQILANAIYYTAYRSAVPALPVPGLLVGMACIVAAARLARRRR